MRLRYRWLTVFLLALCCGCQAHRAKAEVKEVTIYDVAAMVKEKQSFVVDPYAIHVFSPARILRRCFPHGSHHRIRFFMS